LKIIEISVLEKRDNFRGIIKLTLFGFTLDWFREYDDWFVYLKTSQKFIRLSSAGFLMSWRIKEI